MQFVPWSGMHIGLCGLAGVGKGDASKRVAKELGYKLISIGGFFRGLADERRVEVHELERIALTDQSVDRLIDSRMREFIRENNNLVIEGRRVIVIAPGAFRVLLTCEDEVRFERVARRDGISFELARERTLEREVSASARYLAMYGRTLADLLDPKMYDLVVPTHPDNQEIVARNILDAIRKQTKS